MDPENRAPAHDLYVSVLEVERLVASEHLFVTTLSYVLGWFGWGKIGYGRDA